MGTGGDVDFCSAAAQRKLGYSLLGCVPTPALRLAPGAPSHTDHTEVYSAVCTQAHTAEQYSAGGPRQLRARCAVLAAVAANTPEHAHTCTADTWHAALTCRAALARCCAASLATGQPASDTLINRFLTGPARDGPPLWVEARFTFVGHRWYAVMRDISDSKKAERSLHDWLATTSHDARTPLSSIKVSCALLAEHKLCPEARELLATAHCSARVLLMIVQHGACRMSYAFMHEKTDRHAS